MDNYHKPREKLRRSDINLISDAELLAIIIGSGTQKMDVVQLATQMLIESNGLSNLQFYTVSQLEGFHGIGINKALLLRAVFEISNRIKIEKHIIENRRIDTPQTVFDLCKDITADTQENVIALLLNTRFELLRKVKIHKGTISSVVISPRDILHLVLKNDCSAFILVHNHPSGVSQPSDEDFRATQNLANICKELNIQFVDHIVIAKCEFTSIRSLKPTVFENNHCL